VNIRALSALGVLPEGKEESGRRKRSSTFFLSFFLPFFRIDSRRELPPRFIIEPFLHLKSGRRTVSDATAWRTRSFGLSLTHPFRGTADPGVIGTRNARIFHTCSPERATSARRAFPRASSHRPGTVDGHASGEIRILEKSMCEGAT